MAQSQTAFTDKLRIIHDSDGFHYAIVEKNEAAASALYRCTFCGDAIVVTHFAPEPNAAEAEIAKQQEEPSSAETPQASETTTKTRRKRSGPTQPQ